jgi:hypothetical protein
MVVISPSIICNQHCWYCCQNAVHKERPPYEEHDYRWWIDFIDRKDIRVLSISGGEPSLYAGIEHIINHCIDKGILVSVVTNLSHLIPNIKKSWRVTFLASFHEGADLMQFFSNYTALSKDFYITVRELHRGSYKIIPFSQRIEIIENWKYGESHCFYPNYAPDGTLFPKDKMLRRTNSLSEVVLNSLRRIYKFFNKNGI